MNSSLRQNRDDTVLQTTLSLPSGVPLLPVSSPLQCLVRWPESMGHGALSVKINKADGRSVPVFEIYAIFTKSS